MKRFGLTMLVGAAALALVGVALARTPSSATRIVLDHSSPQSGTNNTNLADFVGHLESRTTRCLAGRTVKVFLHNGNDGTTRLLDTDRTGANGLWALGGKVIGANRARFAVTPKTIGGRDHRRICKADSTSIRFA